MSSNQSLYSRGTYRRSGGLFPEGNISSRRAGKKTWLFVWLLSPGMSLVIDSFVCKELIVEVVLDFVHVGGDIYVTKELWWEVAAG